MLVEWCGAEICGPGGMWLWDMGYGKRLLLSYSGDGIFDCGFENLAAIKGVGVFHGDFRIVRQAIGSQVSHCDLISFLRRYVVGNVSRSRPILSIRRPKFDHVV